MQEGNYKNTIVLKNVSSNIVEEAIIVLKENKEAWELEKIENRNNNIKKGSKTIKKDYVVKEAELVVSDYIEGMTKKQNEKQIKNKDLKYKRLKKYAYFTTIMMIMQLIISFCN